MKYCKTCKISYDAPLDHCLFCHGDLENHDQHEPSFKYATLEKRKKPSIWIRFLVLLNLGSLFIGLGLDYFNGLPLTWSLTLGAANVFAIVMLLLFNSKTAWNIKVSKLLITTIIGLFLIGLSIQDYHWALDYVFPFIVMLQLLVLSSMILFNHKRWLDFSPNIIFMSVLGLFPGLFLLLNLVDVAWPSVACLSYSFVTLLGILLLPSKESREEFKSRFHV
ncbi:MAG: DUF6320 domain-containing protein [Acholeplasmataceae bacterium]